MRAFALTCEALAHLDSVEGKRQCAAAYLITRSAREIGVAARFLAGTPLPPTAPAARVILASGYDEKESTRRFAGRGLSGFIQKPYRLADLEEKVRLAFETAGPRPPSA